MPEAVPTQAAEQAREPAGIPRLAVTVRLLGDYRVVSGSRAAMIEAAYDGWKADMLAGRTTLIGAADGADATSPSACARDERVAAGQVAEQQRRAPEPCANEPRQPLPEPRLNHQGLRPR